MKNTIPTSEIRLIETIEIEILASAGNLKASLKRDIEIPYELKVSKKAALLKFKYFWISKREDGSDHLLDRGAYFRGHMAQEEIEKLGLRPAGINEFGAYIKQYGYGRSVVALDLLGKYPAGYNYIDFCERRIDVEHEYRALRCFELTDGMQKIACLHDTHDQYDHYQYFLCVTS